MRRAAVLLILLLATAVFANDTEIGVTAGQTRPLKSSSLRLLREDLRLHVSPKTVRVEVTFRLRNEGPSQEIQLGFPYYTLADVNYDGQYIGELEHFSTRLDGNPVPVSQGKGPNISSWYRSTTWKVWTVPFSPGQTRNVSHSYDGPMSSSIAGRLPPHGVSFFMYVLTTGRNWIGPIGEFHLTILPTGGLKQCDFYGFSLPGVEWRGDHFQLDRYQFTPDRELCLSVDNQMRGPSLVRNPGFRMRAGILPDSSRRPLTPGDLQGRSARELTLLRNEIYARAGRPFHDAELRSYFKRQGWYRTYPGYSDKWLSEVERQNAAFVASYQQTHHLRY